MLLRRNLSLSRLNLCFSPSLNSTLILKLNQHLRHQSLIYQLRIHQTLLTFQFLLLLLAVLMLVRVQLTNPTVVWHLLASWFLRSTVLVSQVLIVHFSSLLTLTAFL